MKEINLEEIANSSSVYRSFMDEQQKLTVLTLMKEAIRQALKLAAENADTKSVCPYCSSEKFGVSMGHMYCKKCGCEGSMEIIDKQSITDTINNVI